MKNTLLRSNGWYYVKQVDGVRQWIKLDTFDEAEAHKRVFEIKDNPLLSPKHTIFRDVQRFTAYKLNQNRFSTASSKAKSYVLDQFCKWLPPESTIANITVEDCQKFYTYLRTKVAESTAASYMMTIRSFFNWVVKVERARFANPINSVPVIHISNNARKDWVRKDHKNQLIKDAPHDDLRFILYCGFDAGMRFNEITEARRDWFDLDTGVTTIRITSGERIRKGERHFSPKNDKERTVPMTDGFRNFLKGYLFNHEPLDFALCPGIGHGLSKYRYDFRKPFTEYMKAQKCEWITPHTMRHSCASILVNSGCNIVKAAAWIGDEITVFMNHYVHLEPRDSTINLLS